MDPNDENVQDEKPGWQIGSGVVLTKAQGHAYAVALAIAGGVGVTASVVAIATGSTGGWA